MSKTLNYKELILQGIKEINDKGGSSSIAVIKWLKTKHGDKIIEKRVKTLLKKLAKEGQLEKVKNSFKLASPKGSKVKSKKTGLALKPKMRLDGKKITGAADIIRKLNEEKDKVEKQSAQWKEEKVSKKWTTMRASTAKPPSKKKQEIKPVGKGTTGSAKRAKSSKSKSATKIKVGSKQKDAHDKTKPENDKKNSMKKKDKQPPKTKIISKSKKNDSKKKAQKVARGKKMTAANKNSTKS